MEKELNIAAILKEKPQNTRLWSPIFGDCEFLGISDYLDPIQVKTKSGVSNFRADGKYNKNGEVCLFPSKSMQDWSKFAWKKGDVLICGFDNLCIFDKWYNEEYTEFEAKFVSTDYGGAVLKTNNCRKALNESTIKQYITKIEEIKGGKLNLETLEIEKQSKFKDGDIVMVIGFTTSRGWISIFKKFHNNNGYIKCYSKFDAESNDLYLGYISYDTSIYNLRLATDSEKQQLFSALAEEGKRWNPDTKQIEDLPKKCEFKAFDKVLVRDLITEEWRPAFFVRMREVDNFGYIYKCLALETAETCGFRFCIPYNEKTAHLLGTTDEWKG